MPVPPPPLRQRLSQSSLRAWATGAQVASPVKKRRLSSSNPLLRGTPFWHRRPLFPLSSRTSRLFSTGGSGAGTSGDSGNGSGSGGAHSRRKRRGFRQRLREALGKTKIEWYPIPIGLGIGYLALNQLRNRLTRRQSEGEDNVIFTEEEGKKKRIRPDGPWYACCPFTWISFSHKLHGNSLLHAFT